MNQSLLDILQWYGAISGAIAAFIVALNLGAQKTGWGFVIFVTSSLSLIVWGFLSQDAVAIGTQNIVLLIINIVGVYRYLYAGEDPKKETE